MKNDTMDVKRGLILCLTRKKGSFSIEYAVMIMVVVVALVGIAIYLRRAICDRWRTAGDTFGYGRQYGQ